jgi:hypothetical protein
LQAVGPTDGGGNGMETTADLKLHRGSQLDQAGESLIELSPGATSQAYVARAFMRRLPDSTRARYRE